jgi:hypothetical protein
MKIDYSNERNRTVSPKGKIGRKIPKNGLVGECED